MTVPFIAQLQVAVTHEYGICRGTKLLEYVMVDDNGNFMNICEGCRDDIIEEDESPGEMRK